MNLYIALLIMLTAALFTAIAGVVVGAIMGPFRPDKAKNAGYECGCDPIPNRGNQTRLSVKYYLTAMMFIIFNIEVVLLYPWAVSFMEQGKFGMLAMTLLVELLVVPFIYVWVRRGFDWN